MYLPISKSETRGLVTTLIVILNIIIYVLTSFENYFLNISNYWLEKLAYSPLLLYSGEWYRVFTSMFTHADIFHIFFNMYFLYFFGREVEKKIGSLKYLILYISSGLLAIVFHTAFISITSSIGLVTPAIGASGAISGVLGAYLLLYHRRVLTFCIFIPLPICFPSRAGVFLIFWFALQVIYGYLRFVSSIAYFAHAGGFIAGISLLYLFSPRTHDYRRFTIYNGVLYIVKTVRKGFGKFSKAILSILVLSLLIGSVYSITNSSKLNAMYVFNIATTSDGADISSDTAVYINDNDVILPTRDDPRVVFNRFLWSGLLKNEAKARYVDSDFKINLMIKDPVYGTNLNLYVAGFIEYDEQGVLKNFKGTITTDVLVMTRQGFIENISIKPGVKYYATIESRVHGENIGLTILQPFSVISTIVSLTAMYIVLVKDRDLVEPEYVYEPVEYYNGYFI
ncbi:MAG: rhomboid family intramembrane serine protease [Desulfurococcaceae archaeon]